MLQAVFRLLRKTSQQGSLKKLVQLKFNGGHTKYKFNQTMVLLLMILQILNITSKKKKNLLCLIL
ncbi:hypothetical protein DXA21_22130 [Parabacteroides distasonis]|nr:hypothetical protein DXA21_22130 [Parabacteroides distasonis]